MEDALPWLRQGDVFEDVPWVGTNLRADREVGVHVGHGSALLITENCQMDKRTRSGRSKLARLQFCPLRGLNEPNLDVNDDTKRRLRAGEISPPEGVFVGDVDGDETFVLLGEAYTLPAEYFSIRVEAFEGHPAADPEDPFHIVAAVNGERIGTLDRRSVEVMHAKMSVFWTHKQPV